MRNLSNYNFAAKFVKAVSAVDDAKFPLILGAENPSDSLEFCGLKNDRCPTKFIGTTNQLSKNLKYMLMAMNKETFGLSEWPTEGLYQMILRFLDSKRYRGCPAYLVSHRFGKSASLILEKTHEASSKFDYYAARGQIAHIDAGHPKVGLGCPVRRVSFLPECLPWQHPPGAEPNTGFVKFRRRLNGYGQNGISFERYREDFGVMSISSDYSINLMRRRLPFRENLSTAPGYHRGLSLVCSVIVPWIRNGIIGDATEYHLWFYFDPSTGHLGELSTYASRLNPTFCAHSEEAWPDDIQHIKNNNQRTVVSFFNG